MFVKGVSGNPKGRAKGVIDKRQRILQAFEQEGNEVAKVVLARAREGDMQAATLVLQRLSPVLKPRGERVQFALDPAAPLAAQAAQVVTAIAAGQLDPESARVVLDCLCQYVTLVQADELEGRIARLEGVGGAHRTLGGVMEMKQ